MPKRQNSTPTTTGAPLQRGIRPLTLTFRGQTITIDIPGWYNDDPTEGILDPEDTKISDRALTGC